MTIHNREVPALLGDHDGLVDLSEEKVYINKAMVEKAVDSVPSKFRRYDHTGNKSYALCESRFHYVPCSADIDLYDCKFIKLRKPVISSYIQYIRIIEQLPALSAQSAAFIPSNVANEISDSYRLFLSLFPGNKSVVTGAFSDGSFSIMSELQVIIHGSENELRSKPYIVFSCCLSSPLKWSLETSQNFIDCSQAVNPMELVVMILCGFLAPVILSDTFIQHIAENLSGVVISQYANPGVSILYGGSPVIFDMYFQITPLDEIETMMIIHHFDDDDKP